jgi:ABC-2 type transport system ATP-binding protein
MDNIVKCRAVTKRFGKNTVAVDNLDWIVPCGAVCGLLGRNGAGKTTLLRMLAGILHPDSGEIEIAGENRAGIDLEGRRKLFYVGQENHPAQTLTVRQLYRYTAAFYPRWSWKTTAGLNDMFGLDPEKRLADLSGGQKRAAYLVNAFSSGADLLILDEPAAGLDPVARQQFAGCVIDALGNSEHGSVILSTHIVADLERTADHISIMHKGAIIVSEERDRLQSRNFRAQLIFADGKIPDGFTVDEAHNVRAEGAVYTATIDETLLPLLQKRANVEGYTLNQYQAGLEDIFTELVNPPQNS